MTLYKSGYLHNSNLYTCLKISYQLDNYMRIIRIHFEENSNKKCGREKAQDITDSKNSPCLTY